MVASRSCHNQPPCGLSCIVQPLMQACRAGDAMAVAKLLSDGTDAHTLDENGQHALFHAAAMGHVHIVDLLSSVSVNLDVQDAQGNTALHIAASAGNTDIVLALARRGASVNVVNPITGRSVLEDAVRAGLAPTVELLLSKGATVSPDAQVCAHLTWMFIVFMLIVSAAAKLCGWPPW